MAIFGVGAFYDEDVSDKFIKANIVGNGWPLVDAPELDQYFRSMKVGDIVYIKAAFGGGDITIKAIGIVKDKEIRTSADTGNLVTIGRNVMWITTSKHKIKKPVEKNNVRSNTVYEEFHPEVHGHLMATIASSIKLISN